MATEKTDDPKALEVEDTEPNEEDEALPAPKYEIFSYPADTTLKGYLEQWNKDQLFIPPFQRAYVWDQTRASKLMESFLLGLPVPPVFLYKPAQSKNYWVIDGHQRIRSVVDFQKGLFGENKFRLKGVDDNWLGKTFDELSEEERFSLETAVLRAVVIQQTNPADNSSIYHIFERLNTGGIRLNPMEVRQCVYISTFLTQLKEWNENKAWRGLLGTDRPDKRLRDAELILRIVSLYRASADYKKPMKKFLSDCAIHFQQKEAEDPKGCKKEMDEIGRRFQESCKILVDALGKKPFHLKERLNYSALDSVTTRIMHVGVLKKLKEKYEALIADPEYLEAVSFNTSDDAVLAKRFAVTKKYLS